MRASKGETQSCPTVPNPYHRTEGQGRFFRANYGTGNGTASLKALAYRVSQRLGMGRSVGQPQKRCPMPTKTLGPQGPEAEGTRKDLQAALCGPCQVQRVCRLSQERPAIDITPVDDSVSIPKDEEEPRKCESCRASGYWDYAGYSGRLLCFAYAVFDGKSGRPVECARACKRWRPKNFERRTVQ